MADNRSPRQNVGNEENDGENRRRARHDSSSSSSSSSRSRSRSDRGGRRHSWERGDHVEEERSSRSRSRERSRDRDRRRRGERRSSRSPTKSSAIKFDVPRAMMSTCRGWMTSRLDSKEARRLRESYEPKFLDSKFELKCPEVDLSFKRRLANEKKDFPQKASEISKVEAREKALLSSQRLVLDIGRPLLFLQESIASDDSLLTLLLLLLQRRPCVSGPTSSQVCQTAGGRTC